MLTAHTYELDELDIAVSEILEMLDLENSILKNSIGIIHCYSEFVETGVVKAVCDALPFPVTGCTTIHNAINDDAEMMLFSISVITADDIEFTPVLTAPLVNDSMEPISVAYQNTVNAMPEKPKMILAYFPLILSLGGEIMLGELDKAAGGIPVFGTTACDHLEDYRTSVVIHDGNDYKDCISMILMTGNVKPKFVVASITEKKLQKQRAIITSSEGSFLMGINDMVAIDYLNEIGVARGDGVEGMNAIPFIVDYNDGTPTVARAMYLVTQDGIVCGGNMPEGSTLAIGSIDSQEVVDTAKLAAQKVVENDCSCAFVYPCLSRILTLDADTNTEFEAVKETITDKPFHFCYSGGEICPIYKPDGTTVNRFHNFTMSVCML